ncbi:MAG: hypothetical protein HRT65_14260 [Flavobacteriaceae bacterium]|nr:hypothetical protein [Flavobacteriaceae bacterium]
MKSSHFTRLVVLLVCITAVSQTTAPRIEIVPPTVAQEAASVWRTINDYTFLEQQGYTIHLPEAPLIDSLILKSKKGTFGNGDYAAVYSLLESRFFKAADYEQAQGKVAEQLDLLHGFLTQIALEKRGWDWDFNLFKHYQVVFTLYGTGGSYDPENGTITLLTNQAGDFVKYPNPAYTIIHEITHMGMEHSVVQAHQLSHGLKERLVDTFVLLLFQEKLPEYRVQQMGDPALDASLQTKKDLASLDAIRSDFVKE